MWKDTEYSGRFLSLSNGRMAGSGELVSRFSTLKYSSHTWTFIVPLEHQASKPGLPQQGLCPAACSTWEAPSPSSLPFVSSGSSRNLKDSSQQSRVVSLKIHLRYCDCCFPVPKSFLRPHELQHTRLPCPSLSPSLLKLMSIELMIPSNHLILCRPFLFLPSIFPSIRVFSNESDLHIRWPKYWSFSFSSSNEYSGLISFRID